MKGLGVFGYKCGMTTFFTENGKAIPVTVIKLYKNYILEKKDINEHQCKLKIAACSIKNKKLSNSIQKIFKNLNIENLKYIKEFYVNKNLIKEYNVGNILNINLFNKNDKLNITSISKGKGFSGVIKRHNFSAQRASHGNSLSHRVPGSIGQCQDPGKVFKGKKMAGRLGGKNVTIKNINIINIYNNDNILLLKGSIPGPTGNKIIINKNIV